MRRIKRKLQWNRLLLKFNIISFKSFQDKLVFSFINKEKNGSLFIILIYLFL